MRVSALFPACKDKPSLQAAIIPMAASWGMGYQSHGTVAGGPAVTVPVTGPGVDNSPSALANTGRSRTVDAPPWFRPSQYFEGDSAGGVPEHAPVSVFSDNQIPVPAGRPAGFLYANPLITRKGGQRQISQPEVVPVWLGLRGTPNG